MGVVWETGSPPLAYLDVLQWDEVSVPNRWMTLVLDVLGMCLTVAIWIAGLLALLALVHKLAF